MCKCWPATTPAAAKSCADCTTGKTFFYDQANIYDSNFWSNSAQAVISKGSPSKYAVLNNPAPGTEQGNLSMLNAGTIALERITYDFSFDVASKGSVGTLFTVTYTIGPFKISHVLQTTGSSYFTRFRVQNPASTILYTQDVTIGVAPFTLTSRPGSVQVRQISPTLHTIWLNGVQVASYAAASSLGVQFLPTWKDSGIYPVGASSFTAEVRFGNIFMYGTGLPYACCG